MDYYEARLINRNWSGQWGRYGAQDSPVQNLPSAILDGYEKWRQFILTESGIIDEKPWSRETSTVRVRSHCPLMVIRMPSLLLLTIYMLLRYACQ